MGTSRTQQEWTEQECQEPNRNLPSKEPNRNEPNTNVFSRFFNWMKLEVASHISEWKKHLLYLG